MKLAPRGLRLFGLLGGQARTGKRNEFNFALHYHSLCCLDTEGAAIIFLEALKWEFEFEFGMAPK